MRINTTYADSPVMVHIFNNGYIITLLLSLCASMGSICDSVVSARFLDMTALAAIGLVYPYTKLMEGISRIFSSGAQVVTARKIGQDRFDEVSAVFYTALIVMAVLSVGVTALIIALVEPLAILFGAGESSGTLEPTTIYLKSLAIGVPAHLVVLFLIPLLQFEQKQKLVYSATIIMTVVNIVLNIQFALMGLGIKGVGFSTAISFYVALLILGSHFLGKHRGILTRERVQVDLSYLWEILREGLPAAFKSATAIVYNTALNNIVAITGSTEALAAFSLYKSTNFIFLSVTEAISNPVRMVQSILYEEKNWKELRRIFIHAISLGLFLSCILSGLLFIFAEQIYGILVTGAVLEETVTMMRWSTILFIAHTFTSYYLSYFQAISRHSLAYYLPITANLLPLPLIYWAAATFGPVGVWAGCSIQYLIAGLGFMLCACYLGRENHDTLYRLLALPEKVVQQQTFDAHIANRKDAQNIITAFAGRASNKVESLRKEFYCEIVLEEIIFNIIEYQEAQGIYTYGIDVHIVLYDEGMVLRIMDNSWERNPFIKYEYKSYDDNFENIGIRIIKSFAKDIKYSFVFDVNFITITI